MTSIKLRRIKKKETYNTKDRHQGQQWTSNQRNQPSKKSSRTKFNYKDLDLDGLCLRRGRNNHRVKDCRVEASKLKCNSCDKTGHISKVCIRTLLQKQSKHHNESTTNYIRKEEL